MDPGSDATRLWTSHLAQSWVMVVPTWDKCTVANLGRGPSMRLDRLAVLRLPGWGICSSTLPSVCLDSALPWGSPVPALPASGPLLPLSGSWRCVV